MATSFDEAVRFRGTVNLSGAESVQHKAQSVRATDIVDGANVPATKLVTRIHAVLAQDVGADAEAQERIVYQANLAGTIREVYATPAAAATGTAKATIDVNRNGSSILTAAFDVDSGHSAYQKVAGSVNSAALSAGQALSISITKDDGGTGDDLPKGIAVTIVIDENGS